MPPKGRKVSGKQLKGSGQGRKPAQESEPDSIARNENEIPELRRAHMSEPGRYLARKLPPMHKLKDIFNDLTAKAMELGLPDVLKHLGGRPLRVATMCSGTESPLLALEMVQNSESDILS